MASKKRRRRSGSSTSGFPDQGTTAADFEEITSIAVPTGTSIAPLADEGVAGPNDEDEPDEPVVSGETTGRTWADVVHPYSSNERYLYLIVLLVVGLGFGATGHLTTGMEQGAAAGLTAVSWIVLYLIQRR